VFVCGTGLGGQLGLGESVKRVATPTQVEALRDVFVVSIATAFSQMLAIAGACYAHAQEAAAAAAAA